MEKTQEILKHLFDLYHEKEWSEQEVIDWSKKNNERYRAWERAFKDIAQEKVFHAIDNYWRYKSNKTQPTIAKLLAMIATDEAKKSNNAVGVRYYNLANDFMEQDIRLGCCKHLISDYNRAVDYIINNLLINEMPASEWAKLDYVEKIAQAQKKDLFNQFNEILEKVCASE